ncbi:hypothetical protein VAFE106499_08995 [Vagococcus fessus]
MKKIFFVIFWLVLALIFTIVLLFNLSSIFDSISYLIIPETSNDAYMSAAGVKHSLMFQWQLFLSLVWLWELSLDLKFIKRLMTANPSPIKKVGLLVN